MNETKHKHLNLEKFGGLAALYGAIAYIATAIVFLVVLDLPNVIEPLDKVTVLVNHQFLVITMHWLSYIIFGILLVVLSMALFVKIDLKNSYMMHIATIFAIIWATLLIAGGLIYNNGVATLVEIYDLDPNQAVIFWQNIEVVFSALSFSNGELLGGLWMLLIGFSAYKSNSFSKGINQLTIGVGVIGTISIIPVLHILTPIFGLGQIVWFIWIGIYLIKGNNKEKEM